jgi:hypothetical protein
VSPYNMSSYVAAMKVLVTSDLVPYYELTISTRSLERTIEQ